MYFSIVNKKNANFSCYSRFWKPTIIDIANKDSIRKILESNIMIDKQTQCWNWQGRSANGHANLQINDRAYTAGRLAAYVWLNFDLDSKLQITRECKNTFCINPEHIKPKDARTLQLDARGFRLSDKERLKNYLSNHKQIDSKRKCWNWTGTPNSVTGYGQIKISKKIHLVHRISAYLWLDFDLNSSLLILHSCDNRRCFNPAHLRPGTHIENSADCILRGRRAFGSATHSAKLNEKKVTKIKRMLKNNNLTLQEIANQFNIGRQTIQKIKHGVAWSHVK